MGVSRALPRLAYAAAAAPSECEPIVWPEVVFCRRGAALAVVADELVGGGGGGGAS